MSPNPRASNSDFSPRMARTSETRGWSPSAFEVAERSAFFSTIRKRIPNRCNSSPSARPTGPAPAIKTSVSDSTAQSHHDCARRTIPAEPRLPVIVTRMKPEPNFELPQIFPNPVDLRVDPEPIEGPALQLVIQTVPLAQKTRILPAELIPSAGVAVGQVRVHPGKH